MKRRITGLCLAALLGAAAITGCGRNKEADKMAADKVADLIDAIYVQQRTMDTDRQCAEARAAWDALTEDQKALVEGEYADPDYFGRDTGDPSLDDPRNQNEIGEKEILVVSFGTSFNDSRAADIKGIEDAIQEANPDWAVRRAFTSQIIINHIQARDSQYIDNMEQAMERAAENGVKDLVIQPTHLMKGAEYDELMETVNANLDRFETVKVAEPLLGDVGNGASAVNEDKKAVAEILTAEAVKDAGFASLDEARDEKTAFVFLGHGTSHTAKVSYTQMQNQMDALGYDNVFIGTVEGEPEETSCEALVETVALEGYKNVILRPFMVVAGDHAYNDMAGEDKDSWVSVFQASGHFDKVETQITGLGSMDGIQQLYVAHTAAAMADMADMSQKQAGKTGKTEESAETAFVGQSLADGVYQADFHTDSSMFQVSDALNGKGTLTVKDGNMTIHISLGSKNILNLYPGLAADAAGEEAEILQPTVDTVTYPDGLTEEVHGFDVPVPALDQEFDLALIGKKGKWYDHKVSVSNPMPVLEDGVYTMDLTFSGGSGKAKILSPAKVTVEDGRMTAEVCWNSPNYDYMVVEGETYLPVNTEGDSVFQIPAAVLDKPFSVIGNTVAMSKPHEVEYTLTFHTAGMSRAEAAVSESNAIPGLKPEGSMELSYAEHFSVDYYEGGYRKLAVMDGTEILVVPEGKEVPEGLKEDMIILKQPVKDLYLVASSVMDMFCRLDGLDAVRLSGQKEDGWYIEEAKAAMAAGDILYAGKYNKPDYELIVSENCSLAIENRMITHTPEVKEMLEDFGIPVMIEYSSYEPHPLGRVEWIKFFGAMLGKEDEAEALFQEQEDILNRVSKAEKTDRSAAFFFITANGQVQVRQSADYIPKMIELAGGRYIFDQLGDPESGRSTVNMQVEAFYDGARDSDFLIYNSSIDGGVSSLAELLDKCPVLEDFKAVKEGNVWCTSNDVYQQSMSIGYLLEDFYNMFCGNPEEKMHYLFRLK